jgi:hypothetical protein
MSNDDARADEAHRMNQHLATQAGKWAPDQQPYQQLAIASGLWALAAAGHRIAAALERAVMDDSR